MNVVSLVKIEEKEPSIDNAIQKALDLIPFKFNQNISNVAIKPNLCYYWDYSTGETTDPKFVGALIDVIRNNTSSDVKISIIESDASAMRCKYSFKILGYEKIAKDKSAKLVNLTKNKSFKTTVNVGDDSREFYISQTIKEADLLINVPKIRYMPQVKISCALKNMYGCNPDPRKFTYHRWLDEAIVILNKIRKPDLCILDGIIVRGTKTFKLGLVMASTDPVAIDAAASKIAGINPNSVRHIVLATRERIGNIEFITKGEELDYFSNLFPQKKAKHKIQGILARVHNRVFA